LAIYTMSKWYATLDPANKELIRTTIDLFLDDKSE